MPERKQEENAPKPQRIEEKTYFSWKAHARPFKRRSREFWVKLIAMATLAAFIMFILESVLSVILVISLVFLFYVLSTVEPDVVEYKVTDFGIRIDEHLTPWDYFIRFWFTERFGTTILVIEMPVVPGRMELVANKEEKEKLKDVLTSFVPEEKSSPTNIDKAAEWLSSKMPE